jgi:hypothetical protein
MACMFNHQYSISFSVISTRPAEQVTDEEILCGLTHRLEVIRLTGETKEAAAYAQDSYEFDPKEVMFPEVFVTVSLEDVTPQQLNWLVAKHALGARMMSYGAFLVLNDGLSNIKAAQELYASSVPPRSFERQVMVVDEGGVDMPKFTSSEIPNFCDSFEHGAPIALAGRIHFAPLVFDGQEMVEAWFDGDSASRVMGKSNLVAGLMCHVARIAGREVEIPRSMLHEGQAVTEADPKEKGQLRQRIGA